MSGFLRSLRSIFFYIKAEAAYLCHAIEIGLGEYGLLQISSNIIQRYLSHYFTSSKQQWKFIYNGFDDLKKAFHYPDKE